MTQISGRPITKNVEERMFEIFTSTVSKLKTKVEIGEFLEDLLSPVEKIMLAKRLSIAVLLAKGYTYDVIEEILRVTPPTIAAVSIRLKYGGKGYKNIVNKILEEQVLSVFWEKIEDIISHIPRSKGTNMSRQLNEYKKEKLKKRKAF